MSNDFVIGLKSICAQVVTSSNHLNATCKNGDASVHVCVPSQSEPKSGRTGSHHAHIGSSFRSDKLSQNFKSLYVDIYIFNPKYALMKDVY